METTDTGPIRRQNIEAHHVEFTGSGREYFRVWIVNVLLSIVTLGIYTPWARRRTAQYFYSHTQVAGSALEFVAQQRKMVFGFLMMAALYIAYQIASDTGQELAASLLLVGFAILLPFLWGSAMRFRLSATRWRGVRLAFLASWKEVYTASWPVFAIAALWIVLFFCMNALSPEPPIGVGGDGPPVKFPALIAPVIGLGVIGLGLTLLCVIRLEYNYRSLLVLRARVGDQMGRWKPVYMDFVRVWLATVGFLLLVVLVGGLGFTLLASGWTTLMKEIFRSTGMGGIIFMVIIGFVGAFVAFVLATLPIRAYRQARMFQLVWNNVGVSHVARFKTDLRTGAFIWLRVKNMLLTVVTLGFYRPFAVASEYAMKVDSVTLHLKGGTDQLVGQLVKQQGAFGDAAADAMGLDLIG
ncbi:YjgN family protein [Ottowia thiooxydans]|uniref:YjgN family protein n=1 Tax=Ottowia thiooxydans TaxID=219182 RepID=UPI00042128FF|nr:YjgN family protein [Ottowia thiooxydans]